MKQNPGKYYGLSTLLTHYTEADHVENAHLSPIFQNSVFVFNDTESGAAIAAGQAPGYYYSRLNNPNHQQLATKLAALEAWDLIQHNPDADPIPWRRIGVCLGDGCSNSGSFSLRTGRDSLLTQVSYTTVLISCLRKSCPNTE